MKEAPLTIKYLIYRLTGGAKLYRLTLHKRGAPIFIVSAHMARIYLGDGSAIANRAAELFHAL
jgi:hypothetical protein